MAVYGEILNEEAYLCEVAGLSKEDLQNNPEKVEAKVRKLLDQKFSSVAKAVSVFTAIITLVAGAVFALPTIGISLALAVFFTATVCSWINDLDTKSKRKSLAKIKAACFKIRDKHEKHLEKNPNDIKCKEALKKITEMIAHIEKIEKEAEHEKEMKEKEIYEGTYMDALNTYIKFTQMDKQDSVFLLFKMFSESDIINRFEKSDDFVNFSDLMSDYGPLTSNNFTKEKQEEWTKDYFFVFYVYNDYAFAYVKGAKKFVKIDYYGIAFFHPTFSCGNSKDFEWYKRIDRELGYYLLSEPPKGITRKPVIEKK